MITCTKDIPDTRADYHEVVLKETVVIRDRLVFMYECPNCKLTAQYHVYPDSISHGKLT